MKPSNTTTLGKATDIMAGICTFPRLPCPCTKRHAMLNLTSTGVCNTGTSSLYVWNLLLWLTWWWMLLYRTLRKVTSTNRRKNMYVVTPRCAAAAAVVSAVWCSDDRQKNTRTRTPWCIADCLLQVLRSRRITTNYYYCSVGRHSLTQDAGAESFSR